MTEDAEIELTRAVDERRQEAVETGAVDAGASQAPIQLGELVELLSAYMLVCLSKSEQGQDAVQVRQVERLQGIEVLIGKRG